MAKTVNINNLGYLGSDYQLRLTKCFIEDQQFFVSLYSIIDQNMFTDEQLRRIVGLMKDRYAVSESVPTYKDLEVLIRSKISDALSVEQSIATLETIRQMSSDAIDIIEDEAEKFFKQQNLTKALNKANDIIKKGNAKDYYVIEDIIKKALETNTKQDLGFRLFENIESDLRENYRQTISTGCPELDESLYGGLGKGELGLLIAPLGTGKAQPLTSKVLTPNGFVNMGDIKVGDEVIGRDGNVCKVTGVFPQGKRPIYKVTFKDGNFCECDIEHLWSVNTFWQRRRKTYVKGSGAKHPKRKYNPDNTFKIMTLKDIIDKGLTRTSKGGHTSFVFKVPNNECAEFNKQDITIDPYLLGYYIGDGCYVRNEITVGVQDYDNAKQHIGTILGNNCRFVFHKKRNIWTICIIKEIRKELNNIVGKEAKSQDKYIPSNYLINSKEVRIALLQGLMDSNGTVDKRGHIEFDTKSQRLSEDVLFLVKSLGGNATINTKNTSYVNKEGVRIDCGISYRVSISFHNKEIMPFRFERKKIRVKYREKYINNNYITNAEFVRYDEAQCIMLDSEEHLYITDNFIVTHNTSVTTGFAASAAITPTEDNNFQGYKVLHFFFEDDEVNIRRKYYGYMLDMDACTLSNPDVRPQAIQLLKENSEIKDMLKNNIIAKRLSSGEVTASEIKNKIKFYIANGFKPDLVIIDYFECLKAEKNEYGNNMDEWSREGVTMRKLESICNDMKIAIWCPIQGTKGSIGAEIVTLANAGGSVKKTQIGHIVLTLAQTDQQKDEGRLSLFVGKLRAAKIGRTKFNNIKFNNGTCKFNMDDLDEVEQTLGDNAISTTAQNIARSVKQEYRKKI